MGGLDEKTGKARAEHVYPEAAFMLAANAGTGADAVERKAGTLTDVNPFGEFGWIKPDAGSDNILLLPSHCSKIGGKVPKNGTRILYTVGADPEKGSICAENVVLENSTLESRSEAASSNGTAPDISGQWLAPATSSQWFAEQFPLTWPQ